MQSKPASRYCYLMTSPGKNRKYLKQLEKHCQKRPHHLSIFKKNLHSIQDMSDQLDDALLNLDFPDHQENTIRDIAVICYEKADGLFAKGLTLNAEFENLDHSLGVLPVFNRILIDLISQVANQASFVALLPRP